MDPARCTATRATTSALSWRPCAATAAALTWSDQAPCATRRDLMLGLAGIGIAAVGRARADSSSGPATGAAVIHQDRGFTAPPPGVYGLRTEERPESRGMT